MLHRSTKCMLTLGLGLFVLIETGCEGGGSAWPTATSSFQQDDVAEENPTWPYWPVHMRIHPLTRVIAGDTKERILIEARLELLDRDDIPTRGVGHVGFELIADDRVNDAKPPVAWDMDIRDTAKNLQHYDDVTQTYLFRLEVDRSQFPEKAELRAYFLSSDGKALRDRRKLSALGD